MPRSNSRKRKKKLIDRRRFNALVALGSALPSVGAHTSEAQTFPEETITRFQYVDYEDFQDGAGGGDRIRIRVPMLQFETPLTESIAVDGSFVLDSISGASPLYLNTLTGASGLGVEDTRRAGDIKVHKYFDRFSVAVGGGFSDEDDYESRSVSLESKYWTEDKLRIFSFGVGGSFDDITSTNNPSLDEYKRSLSAFFGVTQVINAHSMIQSNLSYTNGAGFLSDQYKSEDNRPRSRDQYSWLTRYVRYVPSTKGSLHADYRFYVDSWEMISHTAELAYYHPFGDKWLVRPRLRYYTQRQAQFFSEIFPPVRENIFYSADQRVGSYGGITSGLRVERKIGRSTNVHLSYDFMHQRPSLKLGGGGSSVLEAFSARYFGVGLSKKW